MEDHSTSLNINPLKEETEPPSQNHTSTLAKNDKHLYRAITQNNRFDLFAKYFFPSVTLSEWDDWKWQLQNRITSLDVLEKFIPLTDKERNSLNGYLGTKLPFAITPYYLSIIDKNNINDPIRRAVIPTIDENICSMHETLDPLNEEGDSPVPGIVHRYPDRVLFLVTNFCSVYCRYCTRSRMVGDKTHCMSYWNQAIDYIKANKNIRDVVLSGGDPLTLSDDVLDSLLKRLREIPHLEIIRIGTKVPMVLPHRITDSLLNILKKYHPLFMSIHCTHPNELTGEVRDACEKLANAGIPLGSQTVLLKDINDDVLIMKDLVQGLLKIRIRPYYLYQCDLVMGSKHFRTDVRKGFKIIEGLRGYTSGYAIPHYVIDAPAGGGKIPLLPSSNIQIEDGYILLKNYEDKIFRYPV